MQDYKSKTDNPIVLDEKGTRACLIVLIAINDNEMEIQSVFY